MKKETKLTDNALMVRKLVEDFCDKKLDADYKELSKRLIEKLSRKRVQPLESGKPQIWAAAVIHALGSINFLFDKSFEPYVTLDDINNFFGTKKATVSNKSKEIREMFNMGYYDKEFSTQRMQENNPFADMVMVNGFIASVSSLPEEFQIMVKQARAEGRDISFRTR